jgi:malate synthase
MEDAATAEIARSQVWQWIRHGAEAGGERVTPELVRRIETEELEEIREQVGDEFFHSQGRPEESRELFEDVALSDEFVDFLTLPAYERLED